ncbi:GNAT family N-acetyltransferase [Thiohalobacter sp. IOR34]|uniref:GNAT family N-acetyltransferase n=1 Tax=Thiohalobacter sp. IOR34 TaxID=3057176 RepID=UPI0025AF7081|nr:GNAT family N-acetyltransferase [Thiohalobacter sp. IOR34]WJW74996.1 GNAT family N-acetyltransferase [Thiohalobacter sp. IOR34]
MIETAELEREDHRQAVFELLDLYARDRMGEDHPLDPALQPALIDGLRRAGALVLLAFDDGTAVGLLIGFEAFSTFNARPLLNVHDLAVRPGYRGHGIGRRLLESAEEIARQRGYCKLTLEVRIDNEAAQHLYRSFGFRDCRPPMWFWHKPL